MLKLHDATLSGNCYKVRLMLSHLGLPHERIQVDLRDPARRAEQLDPVTPFGRVPVLVLEDGRPLVESGAILWYLSRGTSFAPSNAYEQARMLGWMFFEQNVLEPSLALARLWVSILGQEEEHRDALREKRRVGGEALRILERHLEGEEYLVGGRFTAADIAVYAYTHVAGEGGFDLEPLPAVRRWLGRVAALPGHEPLAGARFPGSPV